MTSIRNEKQQNRIDGIIMNESKEMAQNNGIAIKMIQCVGRVIVEENTRIKKILFNLNQNKQIQLKIRIIYRQMNKDREFESIEN